jgi:ribosomal protein S18 acetylase RimI-like enzyme
VVFVPQQSQLDDIADWRSLAREVESLFGQAMAEEPAWEEHLSVNIRRGTAWCVRDTGDKVAGGMWLSYPPDGCLHIDWLAVAQRVRRSGAGRALVLRALQQADGRPVHVITFGSEHPGGAEAESARGLYRSLGFQPFEHDPAADGTPRDLFVLAQQTS